MSSADVQSLAESAAKIHDSAVLITDTMHGLPRAIAAEIAKSPRPASTATAMNTTSPASGLMLVFAVLAGMTVMLIPIVIFIAMRQEQMASDQVRTQDYLNYIYQQVPSLKKPKDK